MQRGVEMNEWLIYLLILSVVLVLVRVGFDIRKLRERQREGTYDDRLIERLRARGSDPFKAHDVDFFFALPSEDAAQALRVRLEADGFSVATRAIPESSAHPFSLHASKSMRLSAPDMRALSARFRVLASERGGRYDGWAAGHVPQADGPAGADS